MIIPYKYKFSIFFPIKQNLVNPYTNPKHLSHQETKLPKLVELPPYHVADHRHPPSTLADHSNIFAHYNGGVTTNFRLLVYYSPSLSSYLYIFFRYASILEQNIVHLQSRWGGFKNWFSSLDSLYCMVLYYDFLASLNDVMLIDLCCMVHKNVHIVKKIKMD